eukprot:CAMPEP_0203669000 /NCGR_PEP_ID=MMETSP0090-20130426/5475_1 /ASSEMBLY_ACC=CAM_ASM_001088 /TAXON_ID=426623 /ORGANISM="Chaetoceros affinis, Strain CCMP159" /LENGTH=490 /DNA_ID=CAMNT_0050533571 /DNA_START=61 /DNA_END=1530 /DNA_ORIENTATION=+
MTSAWFGFVIIIFLTAWMLALIVFTILSLFIRCVDCVDGSIIIRRRGRRWRTKAMKDSLVTKKVVDHAFMNDRCQNFLKNRMSYSIPSKNNNENSNDNDVDNKDIEKNIINDVASGDSIEIDPLGEKSNRDGNVSGSDSGSGSECDSENDNSKNELEPPLPTPDPQCQEIDVNTDFDLNSPPLPPPQSRTSQQLESVIYHHEEKEDEGEGENQCSICLEAFQVGESVSWSKHLTHCSHVFHTECITTWLTHKADCPCCRGPFFTKDDLDLRVQGCREFIAACCGCSGRSGRANNRISNGNTNANGGSSNYCPSLSFNLNRSKGEQNKRNGTNNVSGSGSDAFIEIGLDTDDKILYEYRKGAEVCVVHGLIFPPGYVILTKSDEEINGIKRARTRRRFWSSSSSADYYDVDMDMDMDMDMDIEEQEMEYIFRSEGGGIFSVEHDNETNNSNNNGNEDTNHNSNTNSNRRYRAERGLASSFYDEEHLVMNQA